MIQIAVYHVGPKGWTNLSSDDVGELYYSYYLVEPANGYVAAWDHELIPVVKEFKPDIILISAGFDAYHCDIRKLCTPFSPSIDEVSPFPDNEVSLR
ncbi:histone deacetylase 5 [Tanacetum coccineum]